MIIILPALLFFFSGLLIIILQQSRQGFGYAWLIALGTSLLAWVTILYLHWRAPLPLIIENWVAIKGSAAALSFQVNLITWPYAFSLVSITLAVVMTDITRLQGISTVREWAGSLSVTGVGLLAIFAGTPITLALTWTFLDIIELLFVLRNAADRNLTFQAVLSFTARAAGTFLVLFAAITSQAQGVTLTLNNIPSTVGIYLLLAAALRLGVFPIHPPYIAVSSMRRGFGTILRLISPASSLMLLGHLPAASISLQWMPFVLFLATVGLLYGALMWLISKDELSGRPYWLLSLAGITMLCVLRGYPASTIAWGVTLLLSGGVLFLYSTRSPAALFIPLFASLALLGLPFSPSALEWNGLAQPFGASTVFSMIAVFLLFYGYFRFTLQPGDAFSRLEPWARAIYPIGLMVPLLAQWVIGIWGLPGSMTAEVWWAGFIPLVLTIGVLFLSRRMQNTLTGEESQKSLFFTLLPRIWKPLADFLGLSWLFGLLVRLYNIFERLLNAVTLVLEGDGGVLWAFLFLVLLISLISSGGKP